MCWNKIYNSIGSVLKWDRNAPLDRRWNWFMALHRCWNEVMALHWIRISLPWEQGCRGPARSFRQWLPHLAAGLCTTAGPDLLARITPRHHELEELPCDAICQFVGLKHLTSRRQLCNACGLSSLIQKGAVGWLHPGVHMLSLHRIIQPGRCPKRSRNSFDNCIPWDIWLASGSCAQASTRNAQSVSIHITNMNAHSHMADWIIHKHGTKGLWEARLKHRWMGGIQMSIL